MRAEQHWDWWNAPEVACGGKSKGFDNMVTLCQDIRQCNKYTNS